jgi:hypothetical protein
VNKLTINLAMLNRMNQQQQPSSTAPVVSNNTTKLNNQSATCAASKSSKLTTDFYKCPFCVFKHMSRMVIKKHLSTHFYGSQIARTPVYQCSQCRFRAEWQYAVKRHIITAHMDAHTAATCVRINFTDTAEPSEDPSTATSYRQLVQRKRLNRARRRNRLRRAPHVIMCEPVVVTAATANPIQQTVVKNEATAYTATSGIKSATSSSASTISTASSSLSSAKLSGSSSRGSTTTTGNTLPMIEQQHHRNHNHQTGSSNQVGVKRESEHATRRGSAVNGQPAHSYQLSDEDEFHDLDETGEEERFDDMDDLDHDEMDHDMDDMDEIESSHSHSTNPPTAAAAETFINNMLKNNAGGQHQENNGEDDDDEKKHIESINLTDHDGKDFTISYLVANATVPAGLGSVSNTSLNGSNATAGSPLNNGLAVKKKTYFCQSCPYKTNNYCNLKQHLLLHRYRDGCYKCRYCPYYVTMVRLIKQHEIIHGEYEPRGGDEQLPPVPYQFQHHHQPPSSRGGMPFASYTNNMTANAAVVANNTNGSVNTVKHQQLIN